MGSQILNRYDLSRAEGGIDQGNHLHDAVIPDLSKIVRLAFHNCIGDSETGGCNG